MLAFFKLCPRPLHDNKSYTIFKLPAKSIHVAETERQKLYKNTVDFYIKKKGKEKSWSQIFKLLILNITGQTDVGIYFHTPCVLTFYFYLMCVQIH